MATSVALQEGGVSIGSFFFFLVLQSKTNDVLRAADAPYECCWRGGDCIQQLAKRRVGVAPVEGGSYECTIRTSTPNAFDVHSPLRVPEDRSGRINETNRHGGISQASRVPATQTISRGSLSFVLEVWRDTRSPHKRRRMRRSQPVCG